MSSPAWADYLDARLRLVHDWAGEGMTIAEMVAQLTPEADQLALVLLTSTRPPLPGSSRDQLVNWQLRAERLQRELIALMARTVEAQPAPQQPAPRITQVRALLSDPDPERCGCQYWTDQPTPHVHHNECSQAPPPPDKP